MAVSQNPQTVVSGIGTEIWYADGSSDIVTEPYEQVDKLLDPPAKSDPWAVESESQSKASEPAPAPRETSQPPKTPEKRAEPSHKEAGAKTEAKSREEAGDKATASG